MKEREKTIDGIKFAVTAFPAVEAFRLKSYLLRKFGPAIGQALGTLDGGLPASGKIGDVKLDGGKMAQAIETLMVQLDEDEYITFLQRMLRNVQARVGKTLFVFTEEHFETSLDNVFGEKTFTVYPVLLLVLEANYPDFFGKMGLGIGKRIQGMLTSEKGAEESGKESQASGTSES